jgi:hypothetical protein
MPLESHNPNHQPKKPTDTPLYIDYLWSALQSNAGTLRLARDLAIRFYLPPLVAKAGLALAESTHNPIYFLGGLAVGSALFVFRPAMPPPSHYEKQTMDNSNGLL